jgi:hypothetical protein
MNVRHVRFKSPGLNASAAENGAYTETTRALKRIIAELMKPNSLHALTGRQSIQVWCGTRDLESMILSSIVPQQGEAFIVSCDAITQQLLIVCRLNDNAVSCKVVASTPTCIAAMWQFLEVFVQSETA